MSRRILVVRLGAMGDIIHTLPAVASLRRTFLDAYIAWAVEPRWLPLLEGNPDIDGTVMVERSSLAAVLASWKRVASGSFDSAIDFQGLIKSALVTAASGAEVVYGFDRAVARETSAAILYTRTVLPGSAHVVDQNLELAQAAGATEMVREFPIPQGRPEGSLPCGRFVLANPLAGWGGKQWPLAYFSELDKRLREADYQLVLNSPSPISIPDLHVHVSGLPGLIDATRRACAVVGLDSGPLHLAAALGKPGVAIFGPTDPARNGPYCGTMAVLRAPEAATTYKRQPDVDDSMRAITPDQVWSALAPQLLP